MLRYADCSMCTYKRQIAGVTTGKATCSISQGLCTSSGAVGILYGNYFCTSCGPVCVCMCVCVCVLYKDLI